MFTVATRENPFKNAVIEVVGGAVGISATVATKTGGTKKSSLLEGRKSIDGTTGGMTGAQTNPPRVAAISHKIVPEEPEEHGGAVDDSFLRMLHNGEDWRNTSARQPESAYFGSAREPQMLGGIRQVLGSFPDDSFDDNQGRSSFGAATRSGSLQIAKPSTTGIASSKLSPLTSRCLFNSQIQADGTGVSRTYLRAAGENDITREIDAGKTRCWSHSKQASLTQTNRSTSQTLTNC